ncbi:hypothetical protein S100892_00825 [Pediococcus pentosaceus]|uniref:Uncharacterized protein n=1 Tax=Pediococcus pentosaceus TaxID=1255 RepID=A0A1Y0VMM8_PEDPE|nr:hypothetical protein S100892_00825 [Pediococcus pentosaceus]
MDTLEKILEQIKNITELLFIVINVPIPMPLDHKLDSPKFYKHLFPINKSKWLENKSMV